MACFLWMGVGCLSVVLAAGMDVNAEGGQQAQLRELEIPEKLENIILDNQELIAHAMHDLDLAKEWNAIGHLNKVRVFLERAKRSAATARDPLTLAKVDWFTAVLDLQDGRVEAAHQKAIAALGQIRSLPPNENLMEMESQFLQLLKKIEENSQQLEDLGKAPDAVIINAEMALLDYQIAALKEEGGFQAALKAMEKKLSLLEQLNHARDRDILHQLQVQYATREKEHQNELLRRKNLQQQLRNQEIKTRLHNQLLMIALAITLVVIVLLMLLRKREQHKRVMKLAFTDELTGAANRRQIMEFADNELAEARVSGIPVAFVICDLDHFKKFNDCFGHDVGDEVLKHFVRACKESIRDGDQIGRIGGEEWLLVLPGARKGQIEQILERIRKRFASNSIPGIDAGYPLTFSAGISQYDSPSDTLSALLKSADKALYEAKNSGRNQYVHADLEDVSALI